MLLWWCLYLGRKSQPCCTQEAIENQRQWWNEANGVSPSSEFNSSVSYGLHLKFKIDEKAELKSAHLNNCDKVCSF